MIVNVGTDGEPLNLVGYVVQGKSAEAIYRLIGEINGGKDNERTDDRAQEPRGMARA